MILFSEEFKTLAFDESVFKPVLFRAFKGFNRTRENKEISNHNHDRTAVTYQYECFLNKHSEDNSFFLKVYFNAYSRKITLLCFHPMLEENNSKRANIEVAFNHFIKELNKEGIIKKNVNVNPMQTI